MNACMTNAPPERRNHKRSAAPPHRSCGACRSRISRDARFCASSSNAAATREEAPRPAPPPPPGRTPVVCMTQGPRTPQGGCTGVLGPRGVGFQPPRANFGPRYVSYGGLRAERAAFARRRRKFFLRMMLSKRKFTRENEIPCEYR